MDAQRNLEHVLRAAREVFGELGYGAPMEDVARRARVGVGTVYRRFPSKDVLVRRIAEEETARLADQARAALGEEEEPWSALSRFLRASVASGAGRLLPPQILSVDADLVAGRTERGTGSRRSERDEGASGADETGRVLPQQRGAGAGEPGGAQRVPAAGAPSGRAVPDLRLVGSQAERHPAGTETRGPLDEPGTRALLDVVGRLVERARAAGELRPDVAVSDILLVIATAAPALPDAAQQAAASERLLDILLEGLRPRPGHA